MKMLVVYSTMYGSAKQAAELIASEIGGSTILDVQKMGGVKVSDFDRVIVIASIHAGSVSSKMKKWLLKNESQLLGLKSDLILVCAEKKKIAEYVSGNFSKALSSHFDEVLYGGYQYDFEKMNFVVRYVLKKMSGVTCSAFNLEKQAMLNFARRF